MTTTATDLRRALTALRATLLPLDAAGSNPGDLWAGDGRFVGSIDDPAIAAVIVAAVNALPALLDAVEAAHEVVEMAEHTRETMAVIASLSGAYERVDATSLLALGDALDKATL
jgi:hypothetical protein